MDTITHSIESLARHADTLALRQSLERCTDQDRAEILAAEIERRQFAEALEIAEAMRPGR